jgi:membrane protease subunit HflC
METFWHDHKLSLIAVAVAIVALLSSLIVVPETQQAVIIRNGDPVSVVNKFKPNQPYGSTGAGVWWRIPFVDRVEYIDKRVLDIDMEPQQVLSTDQLRLNVDAFARYRIIDPVKMVETARTVENVESQLAPILSSVVRQELGRRSFGSLLTAERGTTMQNIRTLLDAQAREYGAQVIDVRIKRADLPQANQQAVYRRMQTSRQQEAAQIRAVGEQQKREIMANADREVTVTLAAATEESSKTRGEGDAKRTAIFGRAYGKDPSFAAFFRTMQAYSGALASGDTTMVVSPNSDFFRYYNNGPGR